MDAPLQKKLSDVVQHLTVFQLRELIEYAEFITHKVQLPNPQVDAINTICGKYIPILQSSDEFSLRKKEEIKSEHKHGCKNQ